MSSETKDWKDGVRQESTSTSSVLSFEINYSFIMKSPLLIITPKP